MRTENDLQDEGVFVRKVLDEHTDFLSKLYVDDLTYKKIFRTGNLLSTFQQGTPFEIVDSNGRYEIRVHFPIYGRFIEMVKIRKKRIMQESDIAPKKIKVKDTAWYTRNSYGALNYLYSKLSYGYRDSISESIMETFDNNSIVEVKL